MPGGCEQKRPEPDVIDSDSDSDDMFDYGKKFKKAMAALEVKQKSGLNSNINQESDSNQPTVLNNSTMSTDIHQTNDLNNSIMMIASTSQSTGGLRRGRSRNSMMNTASTSESTVSCRRGRSKRRLGDSATIIGPVICIGDFCDGYNMPPQKVSSVPPAPEYDEYGLPIVNFKSMVHDEEDDYDYELLNRIINVKVHWEKKRIHKFPIRMFQSIESIYEHFAQLEEIKTWHVNLKLRNKTLSPTDTPHSINYKVTDFIEGDIVFYKSPYDKSETPEPEEEEEEATFKIKQKDVKHPLYISIKKSERMCILYLKIAEKLGLGVESFTLEFDGEKIKKSDNLESLDLDGDECFDLFQKQKK